MCCVVHCTKSINRKGVSGDFPPKMGLSFEKIKHHQILVLVRGTWCLPYRYTYRITRYFGHTTDNRIKFFYFIQDYYLLLLPVPVPPTRYTWYVQVQGPCKSLSWPNLGKKNTFERKSSHFIIFHPISQCTGTYMTYIHVCMYQYMTCYMLYTTSTSEHGVKSKTRLC